MLEILFLIFLVRKNRENADRNGKNTLLISIVTVVLYYVFFFIGAFLGLMANLELFALYATAFVFAILGALISYIVARI